MDIKEELVKCCDVTPLNYEQYELRFEHYFSDERTGKKIRMEEPIIVRTVVTASEHCSPAYMKNEIIERMLYEIRRKLYESEE